MKLSEKIHWVRWCVAIVLLGISWVAYSNPEETTSSVRAALNGAFVKFIFAVYPALAVILHIFFVEKFKPEFRYVLSWFMKMISYGFCGITALQLMKGVYLQVFHQEQHFPNFGSLDLAALLFVSTYLAVYIAADSTRLYSQVFLKSGAQAVMPAPDGDTSDG